MIRHIGTAPNDKIEAMLVTRNGQAMSDKALADAARTVGAAGGGVYAVAPTALKGVGGGWQSNVTQWAGDGIPTTTPGRLASYLEFPLSVGDSQSKDEIVSEVLSKIPPPPPPPAPPAPGYSPSFTPSGTLLSTHRGDWRASNLNGGPSGPSGQYAGPISSPASGGGSLRVFEIAFALVGNEMPTPNFYIINEGQYARCQDLLANPNAYARFVAHPIILGTGDNEKSYGFQTGSGSNRQNYSCFTKEYLYFPN